jgi:superfamily I DNA/RNA helicase
VERYYIAGDPCQAIYTWQGASPELFESRKQNQLTFLRQSWRLPRKVHSLATQILPAPQYYPRAAEGSVSVSRLENFLEELDAYPGSVYILSRYLYRIPDICDQLYKWGVPFDNLRGPSPYHGNDAIRIFTLRQFLRGSQFEISDFWKLIQDIPAKNTFRRGFKAEIERLAQDSPTMKFSRRDFMDDLKEGFTRDPLALLSMTDQKIAYYKRLADEQGDEILKQKPRVIVGTIHSFKGDECDWAVILSDMTKRSWEVSQEHYLDEARVWYVGVTRARQGVILVPSQSTYGWRWVMRV